MRSQRVDSELCSPFLVNAICAIASVSLMFRILSQCAYSYGHQLQSEHDAAFLPYSRDRVTRGQHFHDEAIRLWRLEGYRPSITNMQALCVLSLE